MLTNTYHQPQYFWGQRILYFSNERNDQGASPEDYQGPVRNRLFHVHRRLDDHLQHFYHVRKASISIVPTMDTSSIPGARGERLQ